VGEQLNALGLVVVGLRIPGHGTLPGALTRATRHDWRAAVRLAAKHVASRARGGPFFIVGYSNGAALAVDYTLEALASGEQPPPDRLVLFSPALAVSRAAALARFQRWLSRVPGLHKLGWTDVLPEYDPYKYNSFPIEAGEQIYDLTQDLRTHIDARVAAQPRSDLPPVLAFQSVVDATIPAHAVITDFLDRLPMPKSELVLFDVNHRAAAEDLMRPGPAALLNRVLQSAARPYAVTMVTNADPESGEVVARSRIAGQTTWVEAPLALSWPAGVYSLSHVALPIPPADPIYGDAHATRGSGLNLGAIEPRGERGVLVLSADQLMRLRHNPFYAYVAARLEAFTLDAIAEARREPAGR
ncbi:MAG: alpha/beta hydrolase, partial [Myxococcales bacterium]|nr:alpha/beta hydrolase [Myxococcales bacterium]